jgi:3-deoxy-D-manno-octulosonic-acid transferase
MSRGWARAALVGYRWFGAGIYPLLGPYLAIRAAKGKEERSRRNERYGRSRIPRPDGPLVWFHAASVGETTAVVPLINEVRRRNIAVVLTTGTVTSAGVARERLGETVIHQYVPLDLKPAVSRFLDHWKPDLAIIAESEIWPMTILELGARRTPQVLVNGRLSDRSFARWSKRPSLADALFENLSHVVAQSDLDAERFLALGARPVSVSGNLKVDTTAPPCDAEELARLKEQIGSRNTWAAISTFEGEDEIAAAVHRALYQRHKQLTILVPRHPDRADAIETMLDQRGLKVARRSRGDQIDPSTGCLSWRYDRGNGALSQPHRNRLRRQIPKGRRRTEPARTGNARLCRFVREQRREFPRKLCASAEKWWRPLRPRWRDAGQGRAFPLVQSAGAADHGGRRPEDIAGYARRTEGDHSRA